jgi:trehalose 6-phosphate synthase
MQSRGGLWFGWDGEVAPSTPESTARVVEGHIEYLSISMDEAEYQHFYMGFCNSVLWPLFHYFISNFRFSDSQYEAFQGANQRFARLLLPELEADDVVWVHDYHLIPLAQKLREGGFRAPIGFFLHIPFPTIEVLRVLPVFAELLQSLLAYDVVGFQTDTDLAGFREGVRTVWPEARITDNDVTLAGRRVVTLVCPIGIDVDEVAAQARDAVDSEECQRMVTGLLGRRLMVGVDRLDYSKGLVQRFRAYERLLETHPENCNRVTFMQIAPLSRTDVRAYSEIRRELEQVTGRTNGRFADTDWTPIRYLNRNFPRQTLMGFLRACRFGTRAR